MKRQPLNWCALFVVLLFGFVGDALAQNLPQDLVAEKQVQSVTELVFTEGPAYHNDGSVYYTDIRNNRIVRLAPGAEMADTFLRPSGRANGMMFDTRGFLVVCEGNEAGGLGGRRLTLIDVVSKKRTIIVDRYQGKRFNSPNDLCIDKQGRIYFTDPYYNADRSPLELDEEAVYRVDSDGRNLIRVLGKGQVARPNGIAISGDNKMLFVVDNHPEAPVRKVLAFDLDGDGLPKDKANVIHDFGSGRGGDGMCIDAQDNIYVAAGANRPYPNQDLTNPGGIYVFARSGKPLGVIPVPEDMVTNCCFGGPDLKTLYVTAGKTLWSIRMNVPGRVVWPAPR